MAVGNRAGRQSQLDPLDAVVKPTLAWGPINLYKLPNGKYLWGCEFELLPAGTMFAAAVILRGVAGLDARPLDDNRCVIASDANVKVYAMGDTTNQEMQGYVEDVRDGFRVHQLMKS
jgi:hypothetical protein